MIREEEPWLTKLSRWWLNHYRKSIQFWVGMHWCMLVLGLMIGMFNGLDLMVVAVWLYCIGMITNTGLFFILKTIKWHLKENIPEEQKPEFYELMKEAILYKIWRYK